MSTALSLLSVVAIPARLDCDRAMVTEANLRRLATSLKEFQGMHRRLPTAEEGLDVLVRRPADWPGHIPWRPFLEIPEVPRDGWGSQYIYVPDPELAEGFGIYSCGRDGVSSSAGHDPDDLNTWSFEGSWHAYYGNREGRESRWCNAIALSIIWVTVVAASTWWTINTGT
jgi:general secretion pathway protein G